jgi:hypothetical protein
VRNLIGVSRVAELLHLPLEAARDLTASWQRIGFAADKDGTDVLVDGGTV